MSNRKPQGPGQRRSRSAGLRAPRKFKSGLDGRATPPDLRSLLAANGLTAEEFTAFEVHLDHLELHGLTLDDLFWVLRRGMEAKKAVPIISKGKIIQRIWVEDNALQLAAIRLALQLHESFARLPPWLM